MLIHLNIGTIARLRMTIARTDRITCWQHWRHLPWSWPRAPGCARRTLRPLWSCCCRCLSLVGDNESVQCDSGNTHRWVIHEFQRRTHAYLCKRICRARRSSGPGCPSSSRSRQLCREASEPPSIFDLLICSVWPPSSSPSSSPPYLRLLYDSSRSPSAVGVNWAVPIFMLALWLMNHWVLVANPTRYHFPAAWAWDTLQSSPPKWIRVEECSYIEPQSLKFNVPLAVTSSS